MTRALMPIAGLGIVVAVAFQNCGKLLASRPPAASNRASADDAAGTGYCLAFPADPACTAPITLACSFDGKTVAEGASVTAYRTPAPAPGSACQAQPRTCRGGILDGTYSFASCSTSGPAACLFNGSTIAAGASVPAYVDSSVPAGGACVAEIRRCAAGVLSGSAPYGACAIGARKSCLFNGTTVPHGGSITAYASSTGSPIAPCSPTVRTCFNGAFTGQGAFASCANAGEASCLFDGATIVSGSSTVAFATSSVPAGGTCAPLPRARA